jgi:GNAT superfamily N-acetyltransferase
MNFHLATQTDIPFIKQIKPSITDLTIQDRLDRQSRGEVEFLLLVDNTTPVCFTLLIWNGKSTHPEYPDVVDLHVKSDERGKGYGTLMIQECERRVIEKGFSMLGMAVNKNPHCPAQKLYKKLGYVHDGKPAYIDGKYDGVEEWVIDMEKILY